MDLEAEQLLERTYALEWLVMLLLAFNPHISGPALEMVRDLRRKPLPEDVLQFPLPEAVEAKERVFALMEQHLQEAISTTALQKRP